MQSAVRMTLVVTVEHEEGVDPCEVASNCLYSLEASPGRGDLGTIVDSYIEEVINSYIDEPPSPDCIVAAARLGDPPFNYGDLRLVARAAIEKLSGGVR